MVFFTGNGLQLKWLSVGPAGDLASPSICCKGPIASNRHSVPFQAIVVTSLAVPKALTTRTVSRTGLSCPAWRTPPGFRVEIRTITSKFRAACRGHRSGASALDQLWDWESDQLEPVSTSDWVSDRHCDSAARDTDSTRPGHCSQPSRTSCWVTWVSGSVRVMVAATLPFWSIRRDCVPSIMMTWLSLAHSGWPVPLAQWHVRCSAVGGAQRRARPGPPWHCLALLPLRAGGRNLCQSLWPWQLTSAARGPCQRPVSGPPPGRGRRPS